MPANFGEPPQGEVRGTPRFPVPYRYRLARVLAPSRKTFALRDDAAFEESYLVGLEGIGVDRIGAVLRKIGDEEGGDPLALLCFEDVHAGQVCHRRMFARWWQARTRQEVRSCNPAISRAIARTFRSRCFEPATSTTGRTPGGP